MFVHVEVRGQLYESFLPFSLCALGRRGIVSTLTWVGSGSKYKAPSSLLGFW